MFEISPDNLEFMQLMLYPMYIGGISILQPWPVEENRFKVVIRPFDSWVSIDRKAFTTFQTFVHLA